MTPQHIAAFAKGDQGGNPAGVWIDDTLPTPREMQQIAADLGYSETAFAMPEGEGYRVRYYAPTGEVAFCGHATIALGAVLGAKLGPGTFALSLRDTEITVDAFSDGIDWQAALQSPRTWSEKMSPELERDLLGHFGLLRDDLDSRLRPTLAFGGVRHAVLVLKSRAVLAAMSYPFEAVRDLMAAHDLVTVSLLHVTAPRAFASRNVFASGGVVEDPATGAAAAALGGALFDLKWDGLDQGGTFSIVQGEDMGALSELSVAVTGRSGDSVRVSGSARWMHST